MGYLYDDKNYILGGKIMSQIGEKIENDLVNHIEKNIFLIINTIFTIWGLICFYNIKGLIAALLGFLLLYKTLFQEKNIGKNAGQFLYLFVFVDLVVLVINQFDVIQPFYSEDIAKLLFSIFENNMGIFFCGILLVVFNRLFDFGKIPAFIGVEIMNYAFAISIGGNGDIFHPEFQALGWAFLYLSTIFISIWYISLEISIRSGKKDGILIYEILYFVGLTLLFNMNFGYIIHLSCEFSNIMNYLTVNLFSFWKVAIISFILIGSAFLFFAQEDKDKCFIMDSLILYFIGGLYLIINFLVKNYCTHSPIILGIFIIYSIWFIHYLSKKSWSEIESFIQNLKILRYIFTPIVCVLCLLFMCKGYYLTILVCISGFIYFTKFNKETKKGSHAKWIEICIFIGLFSFSLMYYIAFSIEKVMILLLISIFMIVIFKIFDTKSVMIHEVPKNIKMVLIACMCLLSFLNVYKGKINIKIQQNEETQNLAVLTNLDEEELNNVEIMYYFSNRNMKQSGEIKQYQKGEIELEDEIITLDITDKNGVTSRFVGYYPRELEKIKTTMSKTKYDSAMKKVKKNIEDYTKIIEESKNKEIPKKGK